MYRAIILSIIIFSMPQNIRGVFRQLQEIKSWKALDFAFPTADARQQAIKNGEFIPGGLVPLDFAVIPNRDHKTERIMITIPRFQNGVPITLGYVTDEVSNENNPLIAPYPNWEMNKLDNNCNSIISVFRMTTDECNRLWVLDSGLVMNDRICPPKLLVFDISNDEIITTYHFPIGQYYNDSVFLLPIVDLRHGECDKVFVYMADVSRHLLMVYDHENRRSWTIQNELFNNEKAYENITINSETFTSYDGLFALTLSPLKSDDRILYFHSLASVSENYVATSVIRNWELFHGNPNASSQSFQRFSYKRQSQSSSEVMDRNGILFYPSLSQTAVACWNSGTHRELNENSVDIVAQNAQTLQFPSSMKIHCSNRQHDQLWLITIRFQKLMAGTLNPNETNFRIQNGFVNELIRGTKCDLRSHPTRQHPHHF